MNTQSMVLEHFSEPLVMHEPEIPRLESGQILVRIEAAGICGSDVHMWKGNDERTPLPVILGHEGVGVVEAINGCQKSLLNQRVLWNRGITCGKCWYCSVLREPSLCENRRVYGINRSFTEPPFLNGCYSRHVILTADTDILPLGDDASDPAILVPASCSGATMAHAFELRSPRCGETVVIQGPGPLGLFAIAFARECGASEIIIIGGSENRLEICRQFGATVILNRRTTSLDERRQVVMDKTRGMGADLVIEAVGQPEAASEGLALLRKGGTYLSTGFSQPPGEVMVDFYRDLVRKNVRIQGVWVSDFNHLQSAVSLVLKHPDTFAQLVTHRFSLNDATEGLLAMDRREALKAVLMP